MGVAKLTDAFLKVIPVRWKVRLAGRSAGLPNCIAMDVQTAESLEIGSYILQLGKSQSEIERSFTILGRLVARHRQIQSISLPIDSQLKNLKNFGGRRM